MDVVVGRKYKHFKGEYYRVLCIACDSQTPVGEPLKELVVYESLYGKHKIWVRPYELFIEKVDKDLYPDIDIFTKEDGIISVMCRGSKSMKSKLRCYTSKFTYANFLIYQKNKLSVLKEADIINNFNNFKKKIDTIAVANLLLELSEQVYKHNNSKVIYNLLINSLTKINEGFNALALLNILELKYLDYLGVMPRLDACSKCGSKDIITLSIQKGGYICMNCRTNEKIFQKKTLKLIRMFYYVDISKITCLNISNEVLKEISEFLDLYYEEYTGIYLKSKNFLNNLKLI